MVVCEGFLFEYGRSCSACGSISLESHHFEHHRHGFRLRRLDNIDLPGNQFQLGIDIFLATVVINGHPSSDITLSLIIIQNNRVISSPAETRSPVGNLARRSLRNFAKNFPIQRRNCEKPLRNSRQLNPRNPIQRNNTSISLQHIGSILRQQNSTKPSHLIAKLGHNINFFLDIFFQYIFLID